MVLVLSLRSPDCQSPNSHSRDPYNIDLPRGGDPDSAQLACAGQLLLRLVVLPASSIDDELCDTRKAAINTGWLLSFDPPAEAVETVI